MYILCFGPNIQKCYLMSLNLSTEQTPNVNKVIQKLLGRMWYNPTSQLTAS